jgi:ubiquinone/menaquinone biosynthesis C-methylase UbiE
MDEPSLTQTFLAHLESEAPAFAKRVRETEARHSALFHELAEPMLVVARQVIGENWRQALSDGYVAYLVDMNRGQALYEQERKYQCSTYKEVFAQTYDDPEFMAYYHWGVYVTIFAWEHHLLLYDFFVRHFVALLRAAGADGRLLELGCGSGIWSSLVLGRLEGWRSTMVDISSTSIELTRRTLACTGLSQRTDLRQGNALEFHTDTVFDAGISCFLLEHLEEPDRLLANLSAALGPRRLAFVTAALTAADAGHIFEFRRESEVVALAEEAGFRVVAAFSSAPPTTPSHAVYLPRSMALVLQKRAGEYW